jgi:ketol-acid reductoisomerase
MKAAWKSGLKKRGKQRGDEMARVFHEEDGDLGVLSGKTIAVIGYGNQGRAQALNLRDSALNVIIGNPDDGYAELAGKDGFDVNSISDAARAGDVVMMLIPDEVMPQVFEKDIKPGLKDKACLEFASGYSVGFGLIKPPENLDVIMIAPRMIGPGVRENFEKGTGFPSFVGVHQDASGQAEKIMLALARGIGTLKAGGLELTMRKEAELDLFTEQGFGPAFGHVLLSSIQTLVDAGFPVEAALVELFMSGEFAYALHRMTTEGVVEQMDHHSHTSQYGSMTRAPRFMDFPIKERMAEILEEISSGKFMEEWKQEQDSGMEKFNNLKKLRKLHPIVKWQEQTRKAFRIK